MRADREEWGDKGEARRDECKTLRASGMMRVCAGGGERSHEKSGKGGRKEAARGWGERRQGERRMRKEDQGRAPGARAKKTRRAGERRGRGKR
jgi:hypothetical protein